MSDSTLQQPVKEMCSASRDGPNVFVKPIEVRIVDSGEVAYIHESILRSHSAFFKAALKKEWKEGQEKAIELHDVDINAFYVWVKWLYTGQFSTQEKADIVKSASSADNSAWDLWRSVYALGDYLQDTDFKDAIIDDMASRCVLSQRHPDLAASYIYPFSSQESPHRQLAIDICVFAWSVEEYRSLRTKKSEEFPPEFLIDVVVYMGEMLAGKIQTESLMTMLASRDVCKYHEHGGKDKKCYKQKRMSLFGES